MLVTGCMIDWTILDGEVPSAGEINSPAVCVCPGRGLDADLFDSAHMLEAAIGMLGLGLWLGGCD